MTENTNLAAEITTRLLCAAFEGHEGPLFGNGGIKSMSKATGEAFTTLHASVLNALTTPPAP